MNSTVLVKSSLTTFLMLSILWNCFAPRVVAQERRVVVSIGQPNIWSLEQAHYLLARMHRQNLDLQTAELGAIDPNETNAQRIDIVKLLVSAGFKYDEAVGMNNRLLKSDKSFNSQRRQELLQQRSALQAQRTQVASEITELKILKSKTKDEDEKKVIQEQIDAKTEQKAAIDDELAKVNDELSGLSSASGNFESAATSDGFDATKFSSGSKLDALIPATAITPKIAAAQRLDNHVGMQYEIIAKQLTLLRDEVGPGERLIFLELPQSINASQGQEKNKYYQALRGIGGMSTDDSADMQMAQVWWRIAGYTRVDREVQFARELERVESEIRKLQALVDANNIGSLNTANRRTFEQKRATLQNRLNDLCERQAVLEAKLKAAQAQSKKEECVAISDDLALLNSTIKETREALQVIENQEFKLDKEEAKLVQSLAALHSKYEKLKLQAQRNKIKNQQDAVDRLWQGGSQDTTNVVAKTIDLLGKDRDTFPIGPTLNNAVDSEDGRKFARSDAEGRQFVSLASGIPALASSGTRTGLLRDRSVRVIDVIPRQNSINVDARKESVKASGVVAAFSFLFGFGGNVRYQRQKEEYEGFLNQELYTSGFGKGDTDFGWSFFPFAGTRQLSPGLRTTYAVAIVPDDAETVVLRAQGCHFARREKQPENYDAANSWKTGKESSRCLDQEQIFVLPIPGGSSRGSDFYVTEIRYSPDRKIGERMVASIYGQNISPQIGVTIDGVPLTQAVGLAQSGVESALATKVAETCSNEGPCGRFERISSEQIVISFKMHDGFKAGTPRIALIAPGKAIEINTLNLTVNGRDDVKLDDSDFMFGRRPAEATRSISDFKTAPDPANRPNRANQRSIGIVTGKFEADDTFYVNGTLAEKQLRPGSNPPARSCKTANLCIIEFPTQQTDLLTVTVVPSATSQDKDAISKTFINPVQLRIINASVASYDKTAKVLTVVLDGSGYDDSIEVTVNMPGSVERRLTPSNGQMILEIKSPAPIVHITLRDRFTNNAVSTIVATPN